ncbi:MAG: PEP-CTERM sorting domain-containing protein [Akkermansiaceae bacterium]|nr:PEP-CTERM sorting domain-containing protein [Akkermansiaceae bacterium]
MKYKHTILTAATLAAFASTATAATIFNDTFDVGATPTLGDDVDDPNDTEWTPFNGDVTSSLVDDGAPQNNVMQVANTGTFRPMITTFSDVTLENGHTLDFSFKIKATSTPTVASGGFRFHLGNGSKGYTFVANWGDGTTDGLWKAASGLSATTKITEADGGNNFDLTGTGWHTVNATIKRVDATHVSFTFGLNGTNHVEDVTVEDLTPAFTFNVLNIGNAGSQETYRLDDIVLTQAVPEPSSAALLGLGGLALMLRRRK